MGMEMEIKIKIKAEVDRNERGVQAREGGWLETEAKGRGEEKSNNCLKLEN